MALSRRHIFPLAGLAAFGITQPSEAKTPVLQDHGLALNISIRWSDIEWEVWTPDPTNNENWRPGYSIAYRWMPLAEFLKEIEAECGIGASVG